MVMDFHGARALQCQQATVAFPNLPWCCIGNSGLEVLEASGPCDKQWHPEFPKWDFEFEFVPNDSHTLDALSWEEVITEIDLGQPFIFGWIETAPITHMMVGIGYSEDIDSAGNLDRTIFYLDPLTDATTDEPIMISFRHYDGSSGRYPHQYDYFRIQPSE